MKANILRTKGININLGCGDQNLEGYIGIDILQRKGTDIICDLENPLLVAAESVDLIYTKSVLEHVENLEKILREVDRILAPSGKFYIYVPHWSNPFFYSDYTHKRFFGLASFDYFAVPEDQIFRSVYPYSTIRFKAVQVRLLFTSPFCLFHIIMKAFQWFINRSNILQLLYEFHLSSLIPCYAIEYILEKT